MKAPPIAAAGWLRGQDGRFDPVVVLTSLVCAAITAVYLLPQVPRDSVERFGGYWAEPLLLVLVVVAIRHGLSRLAAPEHRGFWHRLSAAFAFWLAGDLVYAVTDNSVVGPAVRLLEDSLFFCFYLMILLAVEQRVHLGRRWAERFPVRRLVTAGTVVVLAALLAYFVLIPVWLDRGEYESEIPSFLLFVALDIVLAVRLLILLRECRASAWRWLYGPLAAAMLLWIVPDTMDGLYYAGILPVESGTVLDAVYFAPFLLVVLATRARNAMAPGVVARPSAGLVALGDRVVPGLLLGYAFGLPLLHFSVHALGWGDAGSRLARDVVVLLGLLTLCGLALSQELTMRRRNRSLRHRLDDLLSDEKLESVQRLESLGVLAGGIAHDFNNLLVGILGNSNLILQEPELDREVRERARQIQQAALQAADLTGQMLTYAGSGELTREARDLNEMVAETADLLTMVISKKARLRFDRGAALPGVAMDAVQIRQLILNLITNASEALADGAGEITLTTEVMDADAALLREMQFGHDRPPGRYVALQVADTGGGMDRATRRRMFDPFFSTKFPGRGLGLAAVLGIVRSHRGALGVTSELGIGTTVTVLLPAVDTPPPVSDQVGEEAGRWPAGELGTVLVVEDEEVVRRVSRAMLEALGFEVLEAGDGREGVEVFGRNRDRIVIVLLDLTMPVMDGAEALAEIHRQAPELPVFVMSGYDDESARQRCAGLRPRGFLRKPFRFEDLRVTLRPLLDRGAR